MNIKNEKDLHFWVSDVCKRLPIDLLPETPSWGALLDAITQLATERNELAAQVERLRDYVKRGSPWNTNPDKCERIKVLSETPTAALASLKAQWQAEAFDSPVIETTMKAGCIGEFSFTVRGSGVCPICHEDGFDQDCETCDGDGVVDLSVEVPWYIQKAIFKSMCKYKAASIRQRAQEAGDENS